MAAWDSERMQSRQWISEVWAAESGPSDALLLMVKVLLLPDESQISSVKGKGVMESVPKSDETEGETAARVITMRMTHKVQWRERFL